MSGVDQLRKSVPFPLAGEGARLRYRLDDLIALRSSYDAPVTAPVKTNERGNPENFFWENLISRVQVSDPMAIRDCLRVGLKQSDGKTPLAVDLSDPDWHLHQAIDPIMDALSLARTGHTMTDIAEKLREAAEKGPFVEGASPLTDLISGSDASEPGSEPA